jgi:tetratricopeptide (TPR) repeat protein/TolB-like protein
MGDEGTERRRDGETEGRRDGGTALDFCKFRKKLNMSSLIPGYEYDVFISYRQKDNKYDGWVTEFVDNLKRELEATFKEDVGVYFDINPHDGLLETNDVDASLKEKLKCLVLIPVISQTYCDPKSFAWEHEFKAFIEKASKDQFGLMVKLPNGNVTNRVLPVRIHDLEEDDIKLTEALLGGYLRGVEFIYKEPGVNRPLTPLDDESRNLNKTKYRNQINKVANAIKDIISGMKTGRSVPDKEKESGQMPWEESKKIKSLSAEDKPVGINYRKIISGILLGIIILSAGLYIYSKLFKNDPIERLKSSEGKISVAVLPFQNMTNDTTWNIWQNNIQESLISSLSNTGELRVPNKSIKELLRNNGVTENASLTPGLASNISQKLGADIFIYGSIQRSGPKMRLDAKLIDTKTGDILKPFEITGALKEDIIFDLTDSLRKRITDFLLISKIIKENPGMQHNFVPPKLSDALRYYINGAKARVKGDTDEARNWFRKSLSVDSNFFNAAFALENTYSGTEESYKWLIKNYQKRDQMSLADRLYACWAYEFSFGPPESQIRYLRQLQELDDQDPSNFYLLGFTYDLLDQYDKSAIEYEKYFEIVRKWGKDYLKENYVYGFLGRAYHNTGQFKKEKKVYDESDKYSPDYDFIIYRRAILANSENDPVLAKKYIERYITIIKKNAATDAIINNELGDYNNAIGLKERAEEYYLKAIAMEPENIKRLVELGDFYIKNKWKIDNVPPLMDSLMKGAKNKVEYYNYMNTKGWALYKEGKSREALAIIQKAWEEAPYKLYSIRSHYEEVKKAVEEGK